MAYVKQLGRTPCCKPFRFLELIVIITCFTLLFFLRQFSPEDEIICTPTVLIILYATIGSTFFITIMDVVSQVFREPIPNSPMILSLLLGFTNCLVSGITAVVAREDHENFKNHKTLSSLSLLAGTCFLASLLYILDALVVIRYSC